LPARGHNKQHRGDLRQVSLGMLVSTDFHVPLFHHVYTGNQTTPRPSRPFPRNWPRVTANWLKGASTSP